MSMNTDFILKSQEVIKWFKQSVKYNVIHLSSTSGYIMLFIYHSNVVLSSYGIQKPEKLG